MELEGKQLGHYRLRGLLGSGGMGDVYLAEDLNIPRRVAIKVVRGEVVINAQANQNALRLFTREMKAIAALDHPHILSIIDFGEEIAATGTITYLVMPYRPEGSLADRLRRQSEQGTPPHALAEIVQLIQQAASALQHAHDHHILHLDVKPSNFLVRELAENPRVPDLLLADFGISRFTMATSSASQSVRGTPTSMAPEHWEGKPVAASDQYGLAIMTYQLLTGTLPFTGTMQQVMFQHFSTPPTPPSHINPALPAEIDTVILHALAKDPSKRFASVAAFAGAFQQAAGVGVPVSREIKESSRHSPQPLPIPFAPAGTPLQSALLGRDEQALTSEKFNFTLDIDPDHPTFPAASRQPAQPVPASQSFSPSTGVQASPEYAWQSGQVGHMQPPLPTSQPVKRPHPMLIIALVALIIVLIGGSIGIVAVVRTVQTTATATANANAQVSAQANAQATAQVNAIAMANAQAQATAGVLQTCTGYL
jgi:eukaryotic-like serine/threonine-protein kinase